MAILQIYIPESGLPTETAVPLRFAVRSKTGELTTSGLLPLAELPRGERVELILAAASVLITEIKLPPARGQKLRQALPFAVEENLLTDPETIHVGAGPRQASGLTAVAVVDKAWLTGLIDRLEQMGLRPDRIVTEIALPDLEANAWTIVWNGHDGFLRNGAFTGLALDAGGTDSVPLSLTRALADAKAKAQAPERIIVRTVDESSRPDLEFWGAALGVPVTRGQDWEWAPRFLNLDSAINLLQGEFTPFASLRELVPRLRPIWTLALAILVVQVIATAADWWILSREQRALKLEMDKTFRQVFPDAKIVDPPLQMQRNLAELRRASGELEANDFLPMLGDATSLLAVAPGNKIKALNFDNGALKVDVTVGQETALDALRAQVEERKLPAKIESSTPSSDGGVSARIAFGNTKP
jgi:general secretion pathway protein L